MKQRVRESISTLKETVAYREKIEQAERLLEENVTPKIYRALDLAEECLQFNRFDARALCVKGSCLYYLVIFPSFTPLFINVQ